MRCNFFFTRAKFNANNGLFEENLVKYKGKRTSQDVIDFTILHFTFPAPHKSASPKPDLRISSPYKSARAKPLH